jgi:hypothetical protein
LLLCEIVGGSSNGKIKRYKKKQQEKAPEDCKREETGKARKEE